MDQHYLFHPQTQKHSKKRLTDDQVRLLERSFTANKKLEPERKLELAKELGVPARQVAIWYQNKRARWRTQSLEFDYGALQVKLESVVAEKRKVEKEVEKLRGELKRAQEMLAAAMNKTSCSASNDSCDDRGLHWSCDGGGEGGVLPLEELYACFVDVDRVRF